MKLTIITNTTTLRSFANSSGFTTEFITKPQKQTHTLRYVPLAIFMRNFIWDCETRFYGINHSLSVNINEGNGLTDP